MKDKMVWLEAIVITIVIVSSGVYLLNFNNSHFEPIKKINLNNINQWYHGKGLEVTESNGIIRIISYNNVYASWPLLNSKGFNVYSGETILLSLYAEYYNTAQSSLRIVGNTSKGQLVLGYAFIVEGNSTWQYYYVKVIIPNDVISVFIQLPIGWVISNAEPETIMLKEISLYNININ